MPDLIHHIPSVGNQRIGGNAVESDQLEIKGIVEGAAHVKKLLSGQYFRSPWREVQEFLEPATGLRTLVRAELHLVAGQDPLKSGINSECVLQAALL